MKFEASLVENRSCQERNLKLVTTNGLHSNLHWILRASNPNKKVANRHNLFLSIYHK